MSMVADVVSVAASRKCTLCAVFAVTISFGPPGRLLRSSMLPAIRSWLSAARRRDHPRGVVVFVELDRLAVAEAPEIHLRRVHRFARSLVAPRSRTPHEH